MQYLSETKDSVMASFQRTTKERMSCLKMQDEHFDVCDVTLKADETQIIPQNGTASSQRVDIQPSFWTPPILWRSV